MDFGEVFDVLVFDEFVHVNSLSFVRSQACHVQRRRERLGLSEGDALVEGVGCGVVEIDDERRKERRTERSFPFSFWLRGGNTTCHLVDLSVGRFVGLLSVCFFALFGFESDCSVFFFCFFLYLEYVGQISHVEHVVEFGGGRQEGRRHPLMKIQTGLDDVCYVFLGKISGGVSNRPLDTL